MSKFRRTDNVCALNMIREHVRVSFRKPISPLCFLVFIGGAVPRLAAVAAGNVSPLLFVCCNN